VDVNLPCRVMTARYVVVACLSVCLSVSVYHMSQRSMFSRFGRSSTKTAKHYDHANNATYSPETNFLSPKWLLKLLIIFYEIRRSVLIDRNVYIVILHSRMANLMFEG